MLDSPGAAAIVAGDERRVRQILLNLVAERRQVHREGKRERHGPRVRRPETGARDFASRWPTGPGIPGRARSDVRARPPRQTASTTRTRWRHRPRTRHRRPRAGRRMGGTRWGATSILEPGSTFWAELELDAPSGANRDEHARAESLPWAYRPRVLVVEDTPGQRDCRGALPNLRRQRGRRRQRLRGACGACADDLRRGPDGLQDAGLDRYDTKTSRLLRRREADSHRHTPVIAMTAHAVAGAAEECLRSRDGRRTPRSRCAATSWCASCGVGSLPTTRAAALALAAWSGQVSLCATAAPACGSGRRACQGCATRGRLRFFFLAD